MPSLYQHICFRTWVISHLSKRANLQFNCSMTLSRYVGQVTFEELLDTPEPIGHHLRSGEKSSRQSLGPAVLNLGCGFCWGGSYTPPQPKLQYLKLGSLKDSKGKERWKMPRVLYTIEIPFVEERTWVDPRPYKPALTLDSSYGQTLAERRGAMTKPLYLQ